MKEFRYKNLNEYFEVSDKYSHPQILKIYQTGFLESAQKKLFRAITYARPVLIRFEDEVVDEQVSSLAERCRLHDHKEVPTSFGIWHLYVWHLGSYGYPCYRAKLQALFEEHLKDSRLILDAGCGREGRYLSGLPLEAWGIGLDIDPENVQEARKTNTLKNVSFVVGDLQNLPFVEEAFDLIICCDVLEHVRKPDGAIKELASVLREKGVLLISTSNLLNPLLLVDILLPKTVSKKIIEILKGPSYYERFHRFSPYSLKRRLRKHGLRGDLSTFGFPPFGKPWIYEFRTSRPPRIFYLWTAFDALTNINPLRNFKEIMLAVARKEGT